MRLNELKPAPGSKKEPKRVGRGRGSGHGKTSGRGQKGQKSRSGYSIRRGFEGGQMPLQRRLPKRGFTNIFKKDYALVNIKDLNRFEAGQVVTPKFLIEAGLVKARDVGNVKVLGQGEISQVLYVKAHHFSKSARTKIESAGGRVELI